MASTTGLRGPAQCRELYGEKILLPRIALLAVAVALCSAAVAIASRRHQRRVLKSLTEDKESTDNGKTQQSNELCRPEKIEGIMQRRMKLAVIAGLVWTALFFLNFQAYNFSNADATASAPASASASSYSSANRRPRMVFSFTTTATNIDKIQPTISALLNQTHERFDTIYVVVPRVYREQEVSIPEWLVAADAPTNATHYYGWKYTLSSSPIHESVKVLVLDRDFGPGSKILGTLLVEQDPETIIVYGDDDRQYPRELASRALHYTTKFPNEAVAVLGGWISAEDSLYCGRSLEIGINRVSFVGGAGGVVVRRRFYGKGFATTAAFAVTEMSKACFLGDDYYLSLVLSRNHVRRRVVYDSCWTLDNCIQAFGQEEGLSHASSAHPGGPNVEHYQQCIRELGTENDLSIDAEFGQIYMLLFSRTWGVLRMLLNLLAGRAVVAC